MANKWIAYIYTQTRYRRGELAVALVLANEASSIDDTCELAIEALAGQARVSARQAKRILKSLERDGFVDVERKSGRGRLPVFRLKKVTFGTEKGDIRDTKKVTFGAQKGDISDQEKVTFPQEKPRSEKGDISGPKTSILSEEKGDIRDTKKVTFGTHSPSPSFKEEDLNKKKERGERVRANGFAAPRGLVHKRGHPALEAVRAVTGREPHAESWEYIIGLLGTDPDIQLMLTCYQHWMRRSKNYSNYAAWLGEWYAAGGPPEITPAKANGRGTKTQREQRSERAITNRDIAKRIAEGEFSEAVERVFGRDDGDRRKDVLPRQLTGPRGK